MVCHCRGSASSMLAKHCGRCGGSLAEGEQARAQPAPQGFLDAPAAVSTPPSRPLWKIALPISALVTVGDLPEKSWLTFAEGQPYQGKVRALGSSLDCASLAAR